MEMTCRPGLDSYTLGLLQDIAAHREEQQEEQETFLLGSYHDQTQDTYVLEEEEKEEEYSFHMHLGEFQSLGSQIEEMKGEKQKKQQKIEETKRTESPDSTKPRRPSRLSDEPQEAMNESLRRMSIEKLKINYQDEEEIIEEE